MNIAMRMTGYDMLEFQSSMSRVNPFAQKAGVVFAKPKRNVAYGKGLVFFRRWFTSIPTDFVGIYEEFQTLSEAEQVRCLEEMRTFYYNYSCMEKSGDNRFKRRARVDALPVPKLIKVAAAVDIRLSNVRRVSQSGQRQSASRTSFYLLSSTKRH